METRNLIFPLAAAWHLNESGYHRNGEVLEAIVRGGDALIHAQDEEGEVDVSQEGLFGVGPDPDALDLQPLDPARIRSSGTHWTPMRAPDGTKRCCLGFDGIARTCLAHVHNIPAHHSMALFCAGTVFGREDWRNQSRAFMARVAGAQSPHGWWPEHNGPVVAYNYVYSESLGIYYGMSNDAAVLPALDRAARYHASLTYPDGSPVETVDGRNPYHAGVRLGNAGFSHTAAGARVSGAPARVVSGGGRRGSIRTMRRTCC